jgi:hypothetical protein
MVKNGAKEGLLTHGVTIASLARQLAFPSRSARLAGVGEQLRMPRKELRTDAQEHRPYC